MRAQPLSELLLEGSECGGRAALARAMRSLARRKLPVMPRCLRLAEPCSVAHIGFGALQKDGGMFLMSDSCLSLHDPFLLAAQGAADPLL